MTMCLHTMEAPQPNWDLEQYILNYSGHGQIQRLRFIALKSPALQIDALKYAIRLIKEKTLNVSLYQETAQQLRILLPSSPDTAIDQAWIEHATRAIKYTTEKLEAELKNYKNNLIKESIRVYLLFNPLILIRWVIWILQNTTTNVVTMKMLSNATPESATTVLHPSTYSISV